jgi:hypothetical protein
MPQGWPYAGARLPPGVNEATAFARATAPAQETWVTHPLDLDIGEVADGYHLIARSISLSARHLRFEFGFVPERMSGWVISIAAGSPIATTSGTG